MNEPGNSEERAEYANEVEGGEYDGDAGFNVWL